MIDNGHPMRCRPASGVRCARRPYQTLSGSARMQELLSRAEAVAKGLTHYFTGFPCRYGHVDRRYVKGGRCLSCAADSHAAWAKAHPHLMRESGRKHDKKRLAQDYDKIRRQNKMSTLRYRLKQYGLSLEQYQEILEVQNQACKICKRKFTKGPHVDHCHTHGHVRGLLCSKCNTGLGMFDDDPERLLRAADYLKGSSAEGKHDLLL